MASYKIKKSERHDYAGFGQKVYRKLHKTFYRVLGSREKAYPFYRSYRHRKKKPVGKESVEQYMTEEPAYLAGFGHGLGAWRAGLLCAEAFGLSYAYSPMVNESWDRTLGLGDGIPSVKELVRVGYRKVRLPYYRMESAESRELIAEIIASYEGKKAIFCNEYEQWAAGSENIKGDEIIRKMFWASSARKNDKLLYDKEEVSIALHIRRGDVNSRRQQGDTSMQMRWLELSYYTAVMKTILDVKREDQTIRFYVFSEGEEADFEELRIPGAEITYCLGMSAEESFLHICHADMVVAAPSSFSIEAGAINKNLKIVPDKEWLTYPKTSEWLTLPEDGYIDENSAKAIREALSRE